MTCIEMFVCKNHWGVNNLESDPLKYNEFRCPYLGTSLIRYYPSVN